MRLSSFAVLILGVAMVFDAMARGSGGSVSVHGYVRKDGTYVQPHHRSAPDGVFGNNWSTSGNVNPYTGKEGTLVTPRARTSGDAYGSASSQAAYVPPPAVGPPSATQREGQATSRQNAPVDGFARHDQATEDQARNHYESGSTLPRGDQGQSMDRLAAKATTHRHLATGDLRSCLDFISNAAIARCAEQGLK